MILTKIGNNFFKKNTRLYLNNDSSNIFLRNINFKSNINLNLIFFLKIKRRFFHSRNFFFRKFNSKKLFMFKKKKKIFKDNFFFKNI